MSFCEFWILTLDKLRRSVVWGAITGQAQCVVRSGCGKPSGWDIQLLTERVRMAASTPSTVSRQQPTVWSLVTGEICLWARAEPAVSGESRGSGWAGIWIGVRASDGRTWQEHPRLQGKQAATCTWLWTQEFTATTGRACKQVYAI